MNIADYWVLLELHRKEPTQTLLSYIDNLCLRTGTEVSTNIISRVLEHSFLYTGNLRCGSMIPLDKFWYESLIQAGEFIDTIKTFQMNKKI
mmetsp:Transcript_28677/g.44176  ORF Transcript_28677/g.44176 Transcript_28677/m.44176 type:complete len:91 (+) Transcript_28677:367-639(+)